MKRTIERVGTAALRRIDPETAHGLALRALHTPVAALPGPVTSDRLRTEVAGLSLPNPVGLAAGFDKNATAIVPLSRAGFGWIEVGAATPLAQPGNPRPRLFRLPEDRAAINRFEFAADFAATQELFQEAARSQLADFNVAQGISAFENAQNLQQVQIGVQAQQNATAGSVLRLFQ